MTDLALTRTSTCIRSCSTQRFSNTNGDFLYQNGPERSLCCSADSWQSPRVVEKKTLVPKWGRNKFPEIWRRSSPARGTHQRFPGTATVRSRRLLRCHVSCMHQHQCSYSGSTSISSVRLEQVDQESGKESKVVRCC